MKPLGDGFIKLIKMLIAPIVFTTIAVGIAQMGAMKDVGRIGLRALLYFEVVSTLALVIGLVVVNVLQPGAGTSRRSGVADSSAAGLRAASERLTHRRLPSQRHSRRPSSTRSRAATSCRCCWSRCSSASRCSRGRSRARRWCSAIDALSHTLFAIVGMIMRLAPIGAFGAMAFTVGRYGIGTLLSLGKLMAGVYITCLLFVFVVLGAIAAALGLQPAEVPALHRARRS